MFSFSSLFVSVRVSFQCWRLRCLRDVALALLASDPEEARARRQQWQHLSIIYQSVTRYARFTTPNDRCNSKKSKPLNVNSWFRVQNWSIYWKREWVIFLHVNLLRTMLSILKFYFLWGRLFSTQTTFTLLNKSVAYREQTWYFYRRP